MFSVARLMSIKREKPQISVPRVKEGLHNISCTLRGIINKYMLIVNLDEMDKFF